MHHLIREGPTLEDLLNPIDEVVKDVEAVEKLGNQAIRDEINKKQATVAGSSREVDVDLADLDLDLEPGDETMGHAAIMKLCCQLESVCISVPTESSFVVLEHLQRYRAELREMILNDKQTTLDTFWNQ